MPSIRVNDTVKSQEETEVPAEEFAVFGRDNWKHIL
jgi:hypothetical protein